MNRDYSYDVVTESVIVDYETFNDEQPLEKFFDDLEWEHFKRNWFKKYGYELED